jgi:hypothetical protein
MTTAHRSFGLRNLGSLSGRGRLWAADELLGEAVYSIDVSEDAGGERYAYGTLQGTAGVLVRLSDVESEIKLECGRLPVSIVLLQTSKTVAYFELVDRAARAAMR